jgi:hypothetical protein
MIDVWNAALYALYVKHHGLTNSLNLTGNSIVPNSDRLLNAIKVLKVF